MVQALENVRVVVELRNDTMLRGRLAHASKTMEYVECEKRRKGAGRALVQREREMRVNV